VSNASTFGRGRRLTILLNVVVMVVLAFLVAGIGIYLTGFTKIRSRIDLTEAESYTLDVRTERVLTELDKTVEVITLFDRVPWPHDSEQIWIKSMDYVVDMLQEYKILGQGRVIVRNLDPRIDREKTRDAFQKYGLKSYNQVVVSCGDSQRVLGLDTDLAEIDTGSIQPVVRPPRLIAYHVEQAITSAIFDVTKGERAKIYTLTGHEEVSVASAGNLGGSLLAAALGADNASVEPLSLVAEKAVPDDADAVMLLGPTYSATFLPEEKTALDTYLRNGGRLLVAVDPLGNRELDEALFKAIGVDFERNLICHTQAGTLRGAGATEMWVAGKEAPGHYGRHEITRTLTEDNEVFIVVRSGGVSAVPGTEPAFTSLMLSPKEAFGDIAQSDTESGDLAHDPRVEKNGTRTLAAAIEPTGDYAGSRVVFVPAVAWLTNYMVRQRPGNERFLRRSVKWLIGKGDASIVLPPQTVNTRLVEVPPGEEDEIFKYTAVYLPLGGLLLGFLVWLARRR